MRSVTFTAAVLGGVVSALPQLITNPVDPNPWQAPGTNDVRPPCPGMATLANHGYINRNGKNISGLDIQQGFLDAFGMAFDTTAPGVTNTLNLCTSQLPAGSAPCVTFDLDLLDIPHAIEHDGSMRSQDKGMNGGTGNNQAYNSTIMMHTKDIWGQATHIDYQLAETTRLRRFEQQRAIDDPGWFQQADGPSLTEQAFALATMSDPDPVGGGSVMGGNARVDWCKYWYENARLPTAIGWVKPSTTISQTQLASITNALTAATTIPAASTTSSSAILQTLAPLPFNPYQDVQSPEVWAGLVDSVEAILGSEPLIFKE